MEPVTAANDLLCRVCSLSRHFQEEREGSISDSVRRVDAPWTTGILNLLGTMRDTRKQGMLTYGSQGIRREEGGPRRQPWGEQAER